MVRSIAKLSTTNEYTFDATRFNSRADATHFNSHADAPVLSRAHRLTEGVQGFTRWHWMPPSNKYLHHHIAPTDNTVDEKKNTAKKHHPCRPFWWPWRCTGTIQHASPDGRGPVEATGRRHRVSIASDNSVWTRMPHFFSEYFHRWPAEEGLEMTSRPLITIGVWHFNQMGRI